MLQIITIYFNVLNINGTNFTINCNALADATYVTWMDAILLHMFFTANTINATIFTANIHSQIGISLIEADMSKMSEYIFKSQVIQLNSLHCILILFTQRMFYNMANTARHMCKYLCIR